MSQLINDLHKDKIFSMIFFFVLSLGMTSFGAKVLLVHTIVSKQQFNRTKDQSSEVVFISSWHRVKINFD